jgi:hypothetical protein
MKRASKQQKAKDKVEYKGAEVKAGEKITERLDVSRFNTFHGFQADPHHHADEHNTYGCWKLQPFIIEVSENGGDRDNNSKKL